MIAQVFVLSALLAVSMAAPGHLAGPALLSAGPALTYAAAPAPIAIASAPLTIAAAPAPIAYAAAPAPIAYAAAPAPIAYAAPAPAIIPAPVAYSTGVKIVHTHEPVEQHGYKIVY